MNPEVDWFFEKDTQWKTEFNKLRSIVLSTGLVEELKWGHPCYTLNGANVLLIHGFKEYCAYLLHKGVLLKDPEGILIQQTENVQSARQIRFTNLNDINSQEDTLKAYIYEAIEVEKAGLQVKMKETSEFNMPEEFEAVLEENPNIKKAFERLTPGRQRGYLLYFSQAKQAKTREARIEKHIPSILEGRGLND